MMKKAKHLWLVVLLLCGLSMGVTSCSDDKNNSSNGEQADEQGDKDANRPTSRATRTWPMPPCSGA